jgi:hypothetical protein
MDGPCNHLPDIAQQLFVTVIGSSNGWALQSFARCSTRTLCYGTDSHLVGGVFHRNLYHLLGSIPDVTLGQQFLCKSKVPWHGSVLSSVLHTREVLVLLVGRNGGHSLDSRLWFWT